MAKDPVESAYEAELRERIKKLRKKCGLTQEQVCARTGIKLENYKKYETRDTSVLPPHLFERVAHALDVSIAKLVTGRDEK